MADFTAAGTAYATWGQPMIPFFIFYSMFGFQRVGDLIWAFGDMRGRGFLLGATAGRTTLLGEGLQHDDGHSLLLASTVPNVPPTTRRSPTRWPPSSRTGSAACTAGARRTSSTTSPSTTRTTRCPPSREGVGEGIVRGLYRFCAGAGGSVPEGDHPLLGHRVAGRPARPSGCWPPTTTWPPSCGRPPATRPCARTPSRSSGGTGCIPACSPARRTSPRCSTARPGPIVAVTDFMKAVPDQIARWVPVAVHPARHRRVRAVRHPGGPAPPLRDRRRPRGGGRARRAARHRRGQGGGGRQGHRPLRHRRRRPGSPRQLSATASPGKSPNPWAAPFDGSRTGSHGGGGLTPGSTPPPSPLLGHSSLTAVAFDVRRTESQAGWWAGAPTRSPGGRYHPDRSDLTVRLGATGIE